MRAERWLLEESRYKTMILYIVYVFLFQGTLTSPLAQVDLALLLLRHIIIICHVDAATLRAPLLVYVINFYTQNRIDFRTLYSATQIKINKPLPNAMKESTTKQFLRAKYKTRYH